MIHRHIKLITFNVRSLNDTSRQLDLASLLSHNKIDIGFIQECHLRRNRKIRINGYNIITDNSPVGTAVVIKNCINFRRVYLNNIGMNTCLAQIDFIASGIRKRYLFGSVYIPCNHPTQTLESDLDKLLQFCKTFDAFVLGGDLNSKDTSWGDSNENSNGRTLHSWLGSNLLDIIRICDRAPSYPNGSSFLDHFLVSTQLIDTVNQNYKIQTLPTFSDHFPIKMDLQLHLDGPLMISPRIFTSYAATNWDNFRHDIDDAICRLLPITNNNLQNHEIDELISDFNSSFSAIHNTHSQQIEIKDGKFPLSERTKKLFRLKYSWQKDLKKIFHRAGNRTSIFIENESSSMGSINSGVPQGSVLAPYLFNIFLNDFPHTTADSQAILYADDCLIYAHSLSPIDALQKAESHLSLINEFYQTWGIKINASKSQAICIRNASGKCHRSVVPQSKILQLFLEGTEIPFMETIKYLGVNFNYLLKFNDHGRNSLQKAKRVLGSFSYIMNSRYLPQKTKLLLYKVAIRPLLTYGFPIWFSISPTVIKELEIFERKILRKCINKHYASRNKKFSNKHIYDVSEVKPFSEHAFNLHMMFVQKLATHENDLVKEIYDLEKHTYWSGSTYLSSIAIINENTSDNPHHSNTRRFYHKIPRTHRG
ncbi:uncharacterized protein LOC142242573 [Haematobia irritans]|uniref:uncharacterized protein LOC142242573 n=1 Tax=Haematobia irritans TaxID=7368 RepID=UPI003F4F9F98